MAAERSSRRAGVLVALALAFATAFAACGGGSERIPPIPQQLRTLEQREAGCIACHDGRRVPALDPSTTATPSGHPPLAAVRAFENGRSSG